MPLSFKIISTLNNERPDLEPIEIVERKGIGHPDTICDALSEAVSLALTRYYVDRFGLPLHHNVDKVLLVGGSSSARFGGGEITSPLTIVIAGRATDRFKQESIPVEHIARVAVEKWFADHFPRLRSDQDFVIQVMIHPGSVDLVELFQRSKSQIPLSNDTSIGIGFAPPTPLESLVLRLDQELRAQSAARPEFGLDSKIMALRHDKALELTIACAMVGQHVKDLSDYLTKKQDLKAVLLNIAKLNWQNPQLIVNAADAPDQGSVYLTVSGSSAEAGDDGETGRGNRASGLITPGRPMTMEAMAGKNCVTHTGKIYQIIAQRIAQAVVAEFSDLQNCACVMVSQIGRPVTEPKMLHLKLAGVDWTTPKLDSVHPVLRDIVQAELAKIPGLWREFLDGSLIPFL